MRAAAFRNEEDQKTIQWIVFPTHGFELGEGHFDRVEVRIVGWQRQEPGPDIAQDFGRFWAFVAGQIVQNEHIAALQGGGKLGLDVEVEQVPVDRAVDQRDIERHWFEHNGERRIQPVVAQGGDEG